MLCKPTMWAVLAVVGCGGKGPPSGGVGGGTDWATGGNGSASELTSEEIMYCARACPHDGELHLDEPTCFQDCDDFVVEVRTRFADAYDFQINCRDPRDKPIPDSGVVFLSLCDDEVTKLGLGAGLDATSCSQVLKGSFSEGRCVVEIPVDDLVGRKHVFCRGIGDPEAQVVIGFEEQTTGESQSLTTSQTRIVNVDWRVGGTESCDLHGSGHDVETGVSECVRTKHGKGARRFLREVYAETWKKLFGETAGSPKLECLPHPDDK